MANCCVGIRRLPIQVGDFIQRPEARGGVAMAVQAKRHAQRLGMIDLVHVIDLPVAFHATDAAVDMDGMVEIDVIGHLVDLHPRDGAAPVAALSRTTARRGSSFSTWLWQFMQTEVAGMLEYHDFSTPLWQ